MNSAFAAGLGTVLALYGLVACMPAGFARAQEQPAVDASDWRDLDAEGHVEPENPEADNGPATPPEPVAAS